MPTPVFAGHKSRMDCFQRAGLYWVSSEPLSRGRSTLEVMHAVLRGGGRLIQLREKELSREALLPLAEEARALTAKFNALLIINDHLDIALRVGADGVHLGRQDTPVAEARDRAPDLIIGASSHTEAEAREAEADGASYVNIGPVYPTETKLWTSGFLGLDGVRSISAVLTVPFTVMGGIKREHIPGLAACGARTLAVVTAISAADDPEEATRLFLSDLRGAW